MMIKKIPIATSLNFLEFVGGLSAEHKLFVFTLHSMAKYFVRPLTIFSYSTTERALINEIMNEIWYSNTGWTNRFLAVSQQY